MWILLPCPAWLIEIGKVERTLLLAKAKSSKSFCAPRARFCIFSLDSANAESTTEGFSVWLSWFLVNWHKDSGLCVRALWRFTKSAECNPKGELKD